MTSNGASPIAADLEQQREYASTLKEDGFDYTLTVAAAFVRGMRDVGYRDTARAIDELIDNGIQAGADKVAVLFGYGKESDAKPTQIAVVDNGHGMEPEMLRLSVIWGGTHRENDRSGFGRYGWGLPSASVSMGTRFSVFSRVANPEFHKVTIDLEEIGEGHYTQGAKIVVPDPEVAGLPEWVKSKLDGAFDDGLVPSTAVVVSDLDRLSWKTTTGLERHLLQHLGLIYRKFLRDVTIEVNGKTVQPIDPLFTTPGARYYDLDDDRAVPLDPLEFTVKNHRGGEPALVRARFAYLPPTFARIDKDASPRKPNNNNPRLPIMTENNGIIVMREGRQIDVATKRGWLTVNNDDRYWGVEVDLPASLDEEMAITTSKQQVVLSERMWELFKQHGVLAAISDMRGRYDNDTAKLKARLSGPTDGKRSSERAMADSEKFSTHKTVETETKRRRSDENLKREADRRSRNSGVPREQIEQEIISDASENPFRVREEALPGAPFYRVQQIGGQRVLYLNTDHRFYVDVYAAPDSTARLQAALEIVLFAIGATELEAVDERALFYEGERGAWSERLNFALQALEHIDSVHDARRAQSDADERRDNGEAAA